MKKLTVLITGIMIFLSTHVSADEGMWILSLIQRLNIDTMQSLGFRLSADDIYSINHGSMKDAIVIFNGGCTAEVVSEEGLLLTNHHCGYDAIQNHSTVEHNYLEDGFWAMNKREELPNEGMRVTFLIRVEDVTDAVLKDMSADIDEFKRYELIAERSDSLTKIAVEGTHYRADVESFFGGNNYYLFVYEVFKDIRLVGAPPSSVGKFGYDTDNWTWPRHTGDFSVFRIYAGADGKPADYSPENVPLQPKHYLPVSIRDKNKDDFAMVLGYPGSTTRYMTSYEVKEVMEITNPNRIEIRGLRQDILMEDMLADEKINIQYASKYSGSSNYWKFSIGQNRGLEKLKVIERKKETELEFRKWLNDDTLRKEKYGEALPLIENAINNRSRYLYTRQYISECFLRASEIIAMADRARTLYSNLQPSTTDTSVIDSLITLFRTRWEEFYGEYSPSTDMKVVQAMLKLYKENIDNTYLPGLYTTLETKFKNDYQDFTNDMFRKSIFCDNEKMEQFLNHPETITLENDPAFLAAQSIREIYNLLNDSLDVFDNDYDRGHRLFIAGLRAMDPESVLYSDANFTMRMSYGTIQDYYPRDAVKYDYITTLKGVMEKENPDNWEFVVPPKLKDLYNDKTYGEYGINGRMPVCFLTTNDITGGNSGSPVIDGEGNLVGLAFDGNWEAMSGDIAYESDIQRCIAVDIRYVLFIMDKYAGAKHLVNEMTIIQ